MKTFRGNNQFSGLTFKERFWQKVDVRGPDDCWNWLSAKQATGYGRMYYQGKNPRAHRIAWEFANGDIPEGMHVLHKCDNPSCVNIKHLFLGTHQDNMRDRDSKGRGCTSNNTKLNKIDVLNIRSVYEYGDMSQKALAKIFNVCTGTIHKVTSRKIWAHI